MRDTVGSQNNQIKKKAGITTPKQRKTVSWRPTAPVVMPAFFLGGCVCQR